MMRKPKRSVADAGVLPLLPTDPAPLVDDGVADVVAEVALVAAAVSVLSWGNGRGDMAAWERMPLWRKAGDNERSPFSFLDSEGLKKIIQ
jgi:hypothetical protein